MTAFAAWDTSVRGKAGLPADEFDGSSSAPVFRSVANFTNDGFVSIGVLSGPNMPDAFPANLTCVPEMSALFPLVGLIAAVALTQILRRRRVAQFRAPSSTGKI
jgi:hypothetical protein